jgi:hypothetical protein
MSSGESKERGMTRLMHRPIWVAVALAVIVVVAAAFKVSLASATHVAPFVGTWANDNAATREQTRAVIGVNGANFEVWGYGACGGGECDWAARAADRERHRGRMPTTASSRLSGSSATREGQRL